MIPTPKPAQNNPPALSSGRMGECYARPFAHPPAGSVETSRASPGESGESGGDGGGDRGPGGALAREAAPPLATVVRLHQPPHVPLLALLPLVQLHHPTAPEALHAGLFLHDVLLRRELHAFPEDVKR